MEICAISFSFSLFFECCVNVNGHTAVELVRSRTLLGLLVGGVAVGVGDFALLAELACAGHVQDVDEEGGRGGGQDEAAVCIRFFFLVFNSHFRWW